MRRSLLVAVLLLVIVAMAAALIYLLASRASAPSQPAVGGTQPSGSAPASNPSTTRPSGFFYVNGHVRGVGAYAFSGQPVTVRQAIVAARGLEGDREAEGTVTVIRNGPAQGDMFKLDLGPLLRDGSGDMQLQPNDQVMVNASPKQSPQ